MSTRGMKVYNEDLRLGAQYGMWLPVLEKADRDAIKRTLTWRLDEFLADVAEDGMEVDGNIKWYHRVADDIHPATMGWKLNLKMRSKALNSAS